MMGLRSSGPPQISRSSAQTPSGSRVKARVKLQGAVKAVGSVMVTLSSMVLAPVRRSRSTTTASVLSSMGVGSSHIGFSPRVSATRVSPSQWPIDQPMNFGQISSLPGNLRPSV